MGDRVKPQDRPIFADVKLLTKTGDFVTSAKIPNFRPMAEVVMWGVRVFVADPADPTSYREGIITYPVEVTHGEVGLSEAKKPNIGLADTH